MLFLIILIAAAACGLRSLSALQIDILSGHQRAGVSGKISVNGVPFKAADFRKQSCYVLQRDVLLATATVSLCSPAPTVCTGHLGMGKAAEGCTPQVKEAITTSALLRLPPEMSRKEKKQRVLDVLQQLVRCLLLFLCFCIEQRH